jgi:arylsulfatase A-like enzyme
VVRLDAPHPPYDAPAAGVAPRRPEELILPANVPRGGEAEARARRELAGYHAHIEATDRAIGKTMLPLAPAESAVTVFTSVHGDMHGAHGLFRKGWPHEESVRVPLLVRGTTGPAVSTAPVSLLDLARWTLAWADNALAPPSPRTVEPQRISMPSVVRLPHQCDRTWRGLRTPQRKLIVNPDGSPWLFFDLQNDPCETRNLADDPARAAEILAWRRQVAAWAAGA